MAALIVAAAVAKPHPAMLLRAVLLIASGEIGARLAHAQSHAVGEKKQETGILASKPNVEDKVALVCFLKNYLATLSVVLLIASGVHGAHIVNVPQRAVSGLNFELARSL